MMVSGMKSLKNGGYQYNQHDKLGEGSFAIVYKGVITKNRRIVAIRLLPLKLIDEYGEKIKQIIRDQVAVLKDLSLNDADDGIFTTRIYDCFMTKNNIVMILQFCPQGNLDDLVRDKPMPETQALEVLYQIAKGIEFVSNQKVVHRDIKPENIFIKRYGNHRILKLGDFGFAVKKELNDEPIGTPVFMAPELFREESYGFQVDVWAFGLLAHYILFKEHYFLAESENKVKQRVLKDKYELTSDQLSKISKQMSNFLMGCLQKKADDRPSALTLSKHPVFNSIRNKVQLMMKDAINIHKISENQLLKNAVKGKLANEIAKYNFYVELGKTFQNINQHNYASLYMIKYALGELYHVKKQIEKKINFLDHPDWQNFCESDDYRKSLQILVTVLYRCQKEFQNCFNSVIPTVKNKYGKEVSEGIQKNLGNGPEERIQPQVICYELQNTWFPWLKQHKSPQNRLLSLQAILALHFYQKKSVNFDFTNYQMTKKSMSLVQRTQFLEKALKNVSK